MNCSSWLSRGYWLLVQGLYQSDLILSFKITDNIDFDIIYECVIFFFKVAGIDIFLKIWNKRLFFGGKIPNYFLRTNLCLFLCTSKNQ